jgi:DNA-binding Lrp family transcriptional regulator
MATTALDLVDKELLNLLQSRFPLAEEPYRAIGEDLGIDEADVLKRVTEMKRQNVVREINAIFDTRRLGYKSTLVAFRYQPEMLEAGAHRINEHPGVSHNYARNGYFNLWFTLATPPEGDLRGTIERMAAATGAADFRIMPTIRFFKIGVNFDMVKKKGAAYDYYSPDGYGKGGGSNGIREDWNKPAPVSAFDVEVVRELQKDLPLESRPFDAMAGRLGVTVPDLFAIAADLKARGIMRRYSAVLNHRRAGFKSNAMVVWKVPEERADEVGMIMAESPWVTHCYQRPTFPDWPFTHFTMIHASTKAECEGVARDISDTTGVTEYQALYSTREYKKTRVRYFVEDEVSF